MTKKLELLGDIKLVLKQVYTSDGPQYYLELCCKITCELPSSSGSPLLLRGPLLQCRHHHCKLLQGRM